MSDSGAISREMSVFERYLTIWVMLCIVVGIALGQLFSDVFQFMGRVEVAHINLPVAVLVWLLLCYLVTLRPEVFHHRRKRLRGPRQT